MSHGLFACTFQHLQLPYQSVLQNNTSYLSVFVYAPFVINDINVGVSNTWWLPEESKAWLEHILVQSEYSLEIKLPAAPAAADDIQSYQDT